MIGCDGGQEGLGRTLTLKDKLVVVIRVAQSKHRIAIGEEGTLYVRKSGTKKKHAPNDWPPKEQDRPNGI